MKANYRTAGRLMDELAKMQRCNEVLLRSRHEELLSIYDGIDECVYVVDPNTYEILYINKALRIQFGDAVGKKCYKVFQDATSPCPFCSNKYIFGKNLGKTYIWDLQNKTNKRWYHCIDRAIQWPDGRMVRCELAIDITARKEAERDLRRNEEEFRLIFENAKDAIFWADPKTGMIIKCNRAAEELLEKKREEIVGFSHLDLHPPEKRRCYAKMFKDHTEQIGVIDDEAEVITKSGKTKPVHITASVTSVGGRLVIQGIFRDITKWKKEEEERGLLNSRLLKTTRRLTRLALKDPHTGLYNHRYFVEIVESEFYRAKKHGHSLSLIVLDIDYFRSVNDAYGHRFGDLVLRQFAKKLRRLVRLHDYVIRFGDEEFVVLLSGSDRSATLTLAQRILDSIKTCKFGDKENTVKLKLSMAVVSYPEDSIYKSADLIESAEQILNKVKEYGGDRICSFLDIKNRGLSSNGGYNITDINALKRRFMKLTREANQSLIESISAFAKTIELKDHYTGDHVERTVRYATEIAKRLGLSESEIRLIEQASSLHDLGKIGISEKILLKKGRLTRPEFERIKEHPKIGVDIIRPVHFLHGLIPLILYHHERWDGKGYPCGLRGEEIPIGARVIAIADVYQALTSDRPYRKAFSEEKAIKIIKENSGTQFDPRISNILLKII